MQHETRDLVIRTNADTAALAPALQAVLRELERDMPLAPLQRMDDVVDVALARPGFYASAVASLAVTAVLAAFGIYGTVTAAVALRRRELGVRLALGASRRGRPDARRRERATPTLIGIAAGVPLAAGRILRDQLWIAPTDWSTIVLVAGLMAAVALAAPSDLPSRRCGSIRPSCSSTTPTPESALARQGRSGRTAS